jgi:light-regulated signal transduction histidine kinase (bacteriophytochrome)/CheY-like chemotaxis protein
MPEKSSTPTSTTSSDDLTACDLEPIHQIGSIQAGGYLIGISSDWIIERMSANCDALFGLAQEELLGANLSAILLPDAVHAIRNRLAALSRPDTVERLFAVRLQERGKDYDLAVHISDDLTIIEFEPCEDVGDLNAGAMVRSMLDHMHGQTSVRDLTQEAARLVQALTGYDRVMIYRFHPDLSGEVIAERHRASMESFLGLRYPATDIPKQARALLVRNPVRTLLDIHAKDSPLLATASYRDEPADLSMSGLRSHSPIHLEYLRNMGVAATMTISLLKNGALWGLIACHHRTARRIGFERRTTAEVFAQILALLIDRCERDEVLAFETATQKSNADLLASIALGGIDNQDVAYLAKQLLDFVPCDGTAFCIDGAVTLNGSTPSRLEFENIRTFLDGVAASKVYSTNHISKDCPEAKSFADRAAGMLAIPISTIPRDYLVFFRKETIATVTWAGDPAKAVSKQETGAERLSPRKSFQAWQETVRGNSLAWTEAELRAAEALQVTILEVALRLISTAEAERKAANQTQELLIAELNHRVRNIFGLIHGLISQSRINANDVDVFAKVLGDRIHALARAHDQITAKNLGPGSFRKLIATEAEAYLGSASSTLQLTGPPVLLIPQALSTVALVMHELITNAVKYGAFNRKGGHVDVTWTISKEGSLVVDWCEAGGPPVSAPTHRGFGTTIIKESIPHELNGKSTIEYAVTGVRVQLEIPAQFVVMEKEDVHLLAETVVSPPQGQLGGDVLLVEDNLIIALDAEAMLLSLGARHVFVASNVKDALAILDHETPTFALLDVNLGTQNSFPIADRLFEMNIQFIFATGYGSGINYPPDQKSPPFITKPYTRESIAKALGGFVAADDK